MIIHAQSGFNQIYSLWKTLKKKKCFPYGHAMKTILDFQWTQKLACCKGSSNVHFSQVCFQMVDWFEIGILLKYSPQMVLC